MWFELRCELPVWLLVDIRYRSKVSLTTTRSRGKLATSKPGHERDPIEIFGLLTDGECL